MPIDKAKSLKERIFHISDHQEFNDMALEIFHFQSKSNPVYHKFLHNLGSPTPQDWTEIPCMPISAFKYHRVKSTQHETQRVFKSSGTTGTGTSEHHVADVKQYENSFRRGFRYAYGEVDGLCVLGLLPSYLEQNNSSLIYMVNDMIAHSSHSKSGFYLDDHHSLQEVLLALKEQGQKTLLIGVTFALLDFAKEYQMSFPELIVMETGGMKGRRKEMVREEVHKLLKVGFDVDAIHSEYGMTELMSQAYSKEKGLLIAPPWMKVIIRDIHDPLTKLGSGRPGGLNVIDLANIDSCSFIATDDLGRIHDTDEFEVLGRFDASDIRGCSLLI